MKCVSKIIESFHSPLSLRRKLSLYKSVASEKYKIKYNKKVESRRKYYYSRVDFFPDLQGGGGKNLKSRKSQNY